MTTDEELLTSSLRMLGDGGIDDAELDRRVSQFHGALRRLRDDPAEAARIDALVMDAELAEPDINGLGSGIGVINVNGGNVTIAPGYLGEPADAEDRVNAALERMERQMQRLAALQETLNDTSAQPQSRPRRIWEALLWPALGGGILAAVLGTAAVTAAIHASAAAMSVIGIILAAAAALTALISLSVPWTSVRALNRRGDAHRALELLYGRSPVTTANTSDMVTASGESKRVENPDTDKGTGAARPRFSQKDRTYRGHPEFWVTARSVLDSYARTFRLCLVLLGTTLPVAAVLAIVALLHRALLCNPRAMRASYSHQRRETSYPHCPRRRAVGSVRPRGVAGH
jgi:hypothetical protein